MKKIDFMLKLLFAVLFANVSFGQGGVLAGGLLCEDAVPITVNSGYSTPVDGPHGPLAEHQHWYSFVAPCSGNLVIRNFGGNEVDKRIYSGVCGSEVEIGGATWNIGATAPTAVVGGDSYFIKIDDSWGDTEGTLHGKFSLELENPACPQPTSLASIPSDYDEALIAWFAGGSETEWVVCYGPTGFDPELEGTIITVSGTPATTLTGLSELTCYDYYVQAVCAGGEVSCFKSGPNTFCTPAICPAPLNPTETGITNVVTTLEWDEGADETMWDVSWGPEGYELGDADEVFISETPFDTEFLDDLEADSCYDWYVRAVCIVDLGEGAGDETFYSLWVGPNEWCTNPNCLNPSDGTMIASGGLNATLEWTENNVPAATEWNVQYGEPGFTLGEGTTVTNVPVNPFTLGGLEPGTEYCYYVQSVCGVGEDSLSGWAGPYCFTTSIFCEAPNSLFAEGTSGTEADLDWVTGDAETAWDVSWGDAPLDDPETGTMEDASVFPALSLTGLTPGQQYCYYVRANCGGEDADSASVWAGPFCWTQPALCATPFAVEAINITNTACNINFASPGAESWDLQWGLPCFEVESGDEVGLVDGTLDQPYYITGLDPSTPYWAYVRATCGVDSVSNWAGPILFGTDITNDDPCDAETLVLDGPAILRHNFDATVLPGETALLPPVDACLGQNGWCSGDGVDRTVWFKFVPPASRQVRISTFDTSNCITNGYTEIALYTTGDCLIMDNFIFDSGNSFAPGAGDSPYGSELIACGLDPTKTYYVMVNPVGFIQPEVHFGITLSSIEEVSAGLGLSPTICAGSTIDMFTTIAGHSTEDGTWYNPVVGPGNEIASDISFPGIEASFDFFYVVSNGCEADTVMTTVTTTLGLSAGGDGFVTTCNDYDIILSDHLVGMHDGGGIWDYDGIDTTVALAEGLFAPLAMPAGIYKFFYVVANEFCDPDTAWVTVVLVDCTDLDEESNDELAVYPNPVVDVLTVANVAIEGSAVIEVLDIEGRIILSNQVSNVYGNYTIDMSTVESGVYFVKLTTDSTVQKVRVVKK